MLSGGTFGRFRIFYTYMAVEYMIRLLHMIILTEEIERKLEIHRFTLGGVIYFNPHSLSRIIFPGSWLKTLVSWTLELPG